MKQNVLSDLSSSYNYYHPIEIYDNKLFFYYNTGDSSQSYSLNYVDINLQNKTIGKLHVNTLIPSNNYYISSFKFLEKYFLFFYENKNWDISIYFSKILISNGEITIKTSAPTTLNPKGSWSGLAKIIQIFQLKSNKILIFATDANGSCTTSGYAFITYNQAGVELINREEQFFTNSDELRFPLASEGNYNLLWERYYSSSYKHRFRKLSINENETIKPAVDWDNVIGVASNSGTINNTISYYTL